MGLEAAPRHQPERGDDMTRLQQIAAAIGAAKVEDITVDLDGGPEGGIQITIESERLHTLLAHVKGSYADCCEGDPPLFACPATVFAVGGES